MAEEFFINYFDALGLDPADGREKNYRIITERYNKSAGQLSSEAKYRAETLSRAMAIFKNQETYEDFLKGVEEAQRTQQERAARDRAQRDRERAERQQAERQRVEREQEKRRQAERQRIEREQAERQRVSWEHAAAEQPRPSRRRRVTILIASFLVFSGAVVGGIIFLNTAAASCQQQCVQLTDPGSSGVRSLAFSPDGKTLAIGDDYADTYLWNIASRRNTATIPGQTSFFSEVAFSPDGKMLATGYTDSAPYDGTVYLWDAVSRHEITTFAGPAAYSKTGAYVDSLSFSPNGKMLAVALSPDGEASHDIVCLWDLISRREIAQLTYSSGGQELGGIAFSPDSKLLAIGASDGNTYLWDIAARSNAATFPNTGGAVAFSPSGKILATADGGTTITLWNVTTDKSITSVDYDGEAIAFSPSGKMLAAGNLGSGHTAIFDVSTGNQIATFSDPKSKGVQALAFSPDGKKLATGDENGSAYLWTIGGSSP